MGMTTSVKFPLAVYKYFVLGIWNESRGAQDEKKGNQEDFGTRRMEATRTKPQGRNAWATREVHSRCMMLTHIERYRRRHGSPFSIVLDILSGGRGKQLASRQDLGFAVLQTYPLLQESLRAHIIGILRQ